MNTFILRKATFPVLYLTIILFSLNSAAEELDPAVCGQRVGWFINGVKNTRDAADKNAEVLEEILAANKATSDIKVKLAYNPTAGLIDFFDVFNQKRREWSALTFKEMVEYYLFYQVPSWVGTGERSRFEQSMRDALANTQYNVFKDADFYQIYEAIRLDVDSNTPTGFSQNYNRLLLLAHSQGNLYANAVYEKLVNQDKVIDARSIRYYGIAPATAYQAGNGNKYILSNKDVVINALRIPFQVLPNNADISWIDVVLNAFASATDLEIKKAYQAIEGHSLTEVYLKSKFGMRNRISSEMRALAEQLKARVADSLPAVEWGPSSENWPDPFSEDFSFGGLWFKSTGFGTESPADKTCGAAFYIGATGCLPGGSAEALEYLTGLMQSCVEGYKKLFTTGQYPAGFSEACSYNGPGAYYAAATGYYKIIKASNVYSSTPSGTRGAASVTIAALCK
jgi:hypothetical protein